MPDRSKGRRFRDGGGVGGSYQSRGNEGAERGVNRGTGVYLRHPGVSDNLEAVAPWFNWMGTPQ